MDQPTMEKAPKMKTGWVTLFSFLFTLALIPTLLILTLNQTLFAKEYYKKVLEQQNIYSQFPQLMIEKITSSIQSEDVFGQFLGLMSPEQITVFTTALLPDNYLQNQTEKIIDSIVDYLNLKNPNLSISIDLAPIKANVQGQAGLDLVNKFENSLTNCTQEQIQSLPQILMAQSPIDISLIMMCKPPEPYFSMIIPIFSSILQQSIAKLPSNIPILDLTPQGTIALQNNSPILKSFIIIRKACFVIPWIALFLAVLIVLLSLRSLKIMLRSLGIPLLISGIICVLIFLLLSMFGQFFVNQQIQTITVTSVNEVGITAGLAAIRQFTTFGFVYSGAAVAVGFLLTIISRARK
ncbi:MAG: hypothetical protein AB9897_07310 [Anaerolineaceae bacterium]